MTEEGHKKPGGTRTWPQWIGGFGVLMLVAQLGSMGAWSSPYIIQLTSPDSPFPVTLVEISWVISLLSIGRPLGAIGGAMSINYFGSKTAILITSLPIAVHWLLIALAKSVEWLYAARLFGGIAVGMSYSCFSIYLGEIADPRIRGALVALGTSGIPIGNLLISIMGAYLKMHTSATISLGSSFVLIALFVWLPESPHHLIKKCQEEKAKSSIGWYHRGCDVETEFTNLHKFVTNIGKQSLWDTLKELKTPRFRKSMFLIAVLITYGQLSGINSVLYYMESILRAAQVSVIDPPQIVIMVMAFGILGSFLSMFLMDKCGRKTLMIVSCVGIVLSLTLLTVEFHLLSFGFDPRTVEGLAIVAMNCFYLTIFIGALPVPPSMLGEIFPPHLKCLAAFLTSGISGLFSFIIAGTYLPLLNFMTERYLYLFYGLIMATAVPFTMFCVPETKGMSLQEIQNQLGKDKPKATSKSVDEKKISQEHNVIHM